MRPFIHVVLALAAVSGASAWAQPAAPSVKGSGATTVTRLYNAWSDTFAAHSGVDVQYTGTGSGEGVRAVGAREVAFGASDEPVPAQQLKAQGLVQLPTVVLGLTPVVNLPKIGPGQLRLDGPALSDLFLGRIKTWNDPRLAALNPQLSLPALPVVRVVSSSASGSSAAFTHYLAQLAAEWQALAGARPKWPGEVKSAAGTDAIVQAIQTTPGAIGVISYDRMRRADMTPVLLKNAHGQFVSPSSESMLAAVKNSGVRDNLSVSLINAKGEGSWPLTTLTYVVLDASAKSPATIDAMRFFSWALRDGDKTVRAVGFLPLPPNVQAAAFATLSAIRTPQGASVKLQ